MKKTLVESFENLSDPRTSGVDHKLIDIVIIAILATLCGANGFNEFEAFGKSKKSWFLKYLELPFGIPSHDTFNRVISALDPEEFHKCFMDWVSFLHEKISKEIVSIDGKTVRRTKGKDQRAIHIVSAWANKNKLVLGQIKVNDKSNEITAIPELLKLIDIGGCVITIDAMGTQTEIAKTIVDNGAEYVLALKKNQENLYNDVELYFEENISNKNKKDLPQESYTRTIEKDHGRIEKREYYMFKDISSINNADRWVNLKAIGMVINEVQINDKISYDKRFYIMSDIKDVSEFSKSVRGHWGIETSLHWCLDVGFREDESRARKDNAAENLNIIRHITLNILKKETSLKSGIAGKRLKCGWDEKYMEKVLKSGFEI